MSELENPVHIVKKPASQLLAESAIPFDEACMIVKQMEERIKELEQAIAEKPESVGWVCEDGTPALVGSKPLKAGARLYAAAPIPPVRISPGEALFILGNLKPYDPSVHMENYFEVLHRIKGKLQSRVDYDV